MLQSTLTAAGAALVNAPAASGLQASADETAARPIVDTHQHLWDLTKFKLPWLGGVPPILQRSYVMKDYLQATAGLNVVKAIYMEVDVDPTQQSAEAEQLIEICRAGNTPTAGAVISGRPNSPDFAAYIARFKNSRYIKGVRQVLHVPEAKRGLCLEPQFVKSIQLLGELNMSFDLCMRPAELSDAVKLVDQCRDTRFVIDHCGNADPKAFLANQARGDEKPAHEVEPWKRDMANLAQRPNVICKISGIVARVPHGEWKADMLAPIVNFCLHTFGLDRVVFGGDWPVCLLGATYRRWVEALRQITRDQNTPDQMKLWHDNAIRFYGLG